MKFLSKELRYIYIYLSIYLSSTHTVNRHQPLLLSDSCFLMNSNCLWEVFVWGFGVLFSSCVCVCRCRGCCSLSVCMCVTCWSFFLVNRHWWSSCPRSWETYLSFCLSIYLVPTQETTTSPCCLIPFLCVSLILYNSHHLFFLINRHWWSSCPRSWDIDLSLCLFIHKLPTQQTTTSPCCLIPFFVCISYIIQLTPLSLSGE